VERVWRDGSRILIRASGRVLATPDFNNWTLESDAAPTLAVRPAGRAYRIENGQILRSDDQGASWTNLTSLRGESILGPATDLAPSPTDPDDVIAATSRGLWRSLDGGQTWDGLNENLPNLPVARIDRVASGFALRLRGDETVEWRPGERSAWRPAGTFGNELRRAVNRLLGIEATAVTQQGEAIYAAASDGRILVNTDGAWRQSAQALAGITAIAVDPADPLVAIAAGPRVWRTLSGGLVWDDITADLPGGAAPSGADFDRQTGAIYLATTRGLFLTYGDLRARGPATNWTRLALPLPESTAIRDVKLNAAGTQLYAAVEGYGLFATLAPHRFRAPKLVSAADYAARAAAPGALMSWTGGRWSDVRAGNRVVPVLDAQPWETQIQIPFDVEGRNLALSGNGRTADVPLEPTAPAIFLDRDQTPLIIDADSGVMLGAGMTARSGSRLQILATGLGRVTPDWPAGVPAPLENAPRVNAPVRVLLDRVPLPVLRATLAPGYAGFYLVEFEVPTVLSVGPAELVIEAGGRESNRTSLVLTR
jgi:uncharacterized protein (TIGR03437 family)